MTHRNSIAPADRIQQEMRMLQGREILRTTLETEEEIFMQSVVGRAHEGHGTFAGHRYVDTAEDDIALALRLDPVSVRAHRQQLLDDVAEYVRRVIAGERPRCLLNARHEPIFGFSPFRLLEVDPVQVLGGIYLGGKRDTQEVRLETETQFGVTIGTGKHFYVNTGVMWRMGLDGAQLARGEHAGRIDEYREAGLIVDEPPAADNPVSYMYVRHHRGPGASDDGAITVAGKRFSLSVAAGVLLADVMDTLEKYVPRDRYGDQDADLAQQIEADFPDLPFGADDARELTYLSRGGEGMVDCSLRHMLRVDRTVDQCAAEGHLLYCAGLAHAPLRLGHEKISSAAFYARVEQRLAKFEAS